MADWEAIRPGSKHWARLQKLFEQALELGDRDRTELLDSISQSEPHLVAELEKLLAADKEQIHSTLPDPLSGLAGCQAESGIAHLSGQRIGSFELKEVIGTGGMGAVYLAERIDGRVDQQVAIKFANQRLMDEEARRRFLMERRILANLDHPNIAKLTDAGEIQGEVPYLVMEFVQGVSLTEYCDQQQLTIPERLKLILKVCDAVSYAHRNLIVHRDLKPSNILVGEDGEPKLLDFGIAKPLDELASVLGDQAVETTSVMLSPQYAAPERFDGPVHSVSCDIYGVGLLLYELLSGCLPYDLSRKNYTEALDLIRNQAPKAPSVVVRRTENWRTRGNSSANQLSQLLAGDLDAIIEKSLRKLPEERYTTMDQLIEDIRSYQNNLPVRASGGQRLYRMSKWMKRNRGGVVIASVFVLAVTSFIVVLAIQSDELRVQRDEAVAERQRAEQEKEKAEAVTNVLVDAFGSANPNRTLGAEITAKEILDQSEQNISKELANQPLVKARLLWTLSTIYRNLGEMSKSRDLSDEAYLLISPRAKEDAELFVRISRSKARSLTQQYKLEEAMAYLQSALDVADQVTDYNHVAGLELQYAAMLFNFDRYQEAVVQAEQTLGNLKVYSGSTEKSIADGHATLGQILSAKGDRERGLQELRAALAIQRSIYSDKHLAVGSTLMQIARSQELLKRYDEALQSLLEAKKIYSTVLGADNLRMSGILSRISIVESDRENFEAAQQVTLELLDLLERHDANTALTRYNYARLLHRMDEPPEMADGYINDALAEYSPNGDSRDSRYARMLTVKGFTLVLLGRPDEAIAILDDASDILLQVESGLDSLLQYTSIVKALARYQQSGSTSIGVINEALSGYDIDDDPVLRRTILRMIPEDELPTSLLKQEANHQH